MSKKILIYGGSGGIGLATAKLLHERGYETHLASRNIDKLSEIADELKVEYSVGDVNDNNFFPLVSKNVGTKLDGLVYAVGTINLRSLKLLTEEDYLNDFRINALGAAHAVREALPSLKNCEGTASVVLFSSVAALQGFSSHASISMAKGAVIGLTLSLAAELAPKIRVNAIAPSLTKTPLAEPFIPNEKLASKIADLHPLKRLGVPNDIASLAAFLLSPDSSWLTGQVISVDGGRSTLCI
jgi:NAD(P)-dependent dehydrogenase (short-subunit alcohol dehydrogenase family)